MPELTDLLARLRAEDAAQRATEAEQIAKERPH
jgi:hypothetical protein